MTGSETRALSRVAGILLLASAVRFGNQLRSRPVTAPEPGGDPLPGLLEESRSARKDDSVRARPLEPGEKIDPNRASVQEIDRLPGIGPAIAEALVRERDSLGVFSSVEDLTRVPGIGPATVARLAPYLDFGRPPPLGRRIVRSSPGVGGRATLDPDPPRVDVNRATGEELQALPGIGPALARRILETRSERGGFASVEELKEVRGIGDATLERLRPFIVVGGATGRDA